MAKHDAHDLLTTVACSLGGLLFATLVYTHSGAMEGEIRLSRPRPVADLAAHNLPPDACWRVLGPLFERTRRNPKALWLWTEQSEVGGRNGVEWTREPVATLAPPRPYALSPSAAALPSSACAHPKNSIHLVTSEWRLMVSDRPGADDTTIITAGQ